MSQKVNEVKANLSEILELPKDIVLDLPRITLVGNLQIYIENHKGIIEYTKQRIRISTKSGVLRITGKNMVIRIIVTEEIVITGDISSIEFVE